MPTYTIQADVSAIRNDEGEDVFRLAVSVLRDALIVASFIQDFGIAVTNADMRASIEGKVFEMVRNDYDALKIQAINQRAAAIEANLNAWSKTLP